MNDHKKLSNEFGSKARKLQAHEKRASLRKPSKEDLEELDGDAVKTTSGETFTGSQSSDLAWMVYLRFGRDTAAAHRAWCRMLQNNCTESQFIGLLVKSELSDLPDPAIG